MIVTKDEVKTLILESSTTYDDYIEALIPYVEEEICNYCKNDFCDVRFTYFSSNDITFDSSDNSINFTDIDSYDLKVNDTIRVYGSLRNDRAFSINTINSNSLIIDSIYSIEDEDETDEVKYITKIKYPLTIKLIISQMIKFNIDTLKLTSGAKSEKIDDYSITLEDMKDYPSQILSKLNRYRKLYKETLVSKIGGIYI